MKSSILRILAVLVSSTFLIFFFQNCSGGFKNPDVGSLSAASLNDGGGADESLGSCAFNGGNIATGTSVLAYQTSHVPAGSTCTMQTRTCTQGTLSGTYAFASCTVDVAANAACSFNGANVASGSSVQAFLAPSVAAPLTCSSQTRNCINGALSGSYAFSTCTVTGGAKTYSYDPNNTVTTTTTYCDMGGCNNTATSPVQSPYQFTVPSYTTLVVKVWGGGAGAGHMGGWGGDSYFGSVLAKTGFPSGGRASASLAFGHGGAASGGDINTTGNATVGVNGGGSPMGGNGTIFTSFANCTIAQVPGGGGGSPSGGGGGGGFAQKTYHAGDLAVGAVVSVAVGTGGGSQQAQQDILGCSMGRFGRVEITWQ